MHLSLAIWDCLAMPGAQPISNRRLLGSNMVATKHLLPSNLSSGQGYQLHPLRMDSLI